MSVNTMPQLSVLLARKALFMDSMFYEFCCISVITMACRRLVVLRLADFWFFSKSTAARFWLIVYTMELA
jgi:hypothetical protein